MEYSQSRAARSVLQNQFGQSQVPENQGWDMVGRRETQEGGDMGIYVYV